MALSELTASELNARRPSQQTNQLKEVSSSGDTTKTGLKRKFDICMYSHDYLSWETGDIRPAPPDPSHDPIVGGHRRTDLPPQDNATSYNPSITQKAESNHQLTFSLDTRPSNESQVPLEGFTPVKLQPRAVAAAALHAQELQIANSNHTTDVHTASQKLRQPFRTPGKQVTEPDGPRPSTDLSPQVATAEPRHLKANSIGQGIASDDEDTASETEASISKTLGVGHTERTEGSPKQLDTQGVVGASNHLFQSAAAVQDSQTQEVSGILQAGDPLQSEFEQLLEREELIAQEEGEMDLPLKDLIEDAIEKQPSETEEHADSGKSLSSKVAPVAKMTDRQRSGPVTKSHDTSGRVTRDTSVSISDNIIVLHGSDGDTSTTQATSPKAPKKTDSRKTSVSSPGSEEDMSTADEAQSKPCRKTYSKKKSTSQSKQKQPTVSAKKKNLRKSIEASPPERASASRNHLKVFYASSSKVILASGNKAKLTRLGVFQAQVVPDCNIFCTDSGSPLVKSPNLLHALALGKPIVSDDWLQHSIDVNMLKDYTHYLTKDVTRERQWKCKLRESHDKYRNGFKPFDEMTVAITPGLKSELGDLYEGICTVALAAGAEEATSRTPRRSENAEEMIWLAKERDPLLDQLDGQQVFKKDLVTMSVLRANLDLESDEFRLNTSVAKEPPRKRKKKA